MKPNSKFDGLWSYSSKMTYYSTPNNGQISNIFWIARWGRVICWSLVLRLLFLSIWHFKRKTLLEEKMLKLGESQPTCRRQFIFCFNLLRNNLTTNKSKLKIVDRFGAFQKLKCKYIFTKYLFIENLILMYIVLKENNRLDKQSSD